MQPDEHGFLHPAVDSVKCTDCGICALKCPVSTPPQISVHTDALTGYANDETLLSKSSSGAIFPVLAVEIIRRGGVVFGAAFDKYFNVVHTAAETISEFSSLCSSKYVQSRIESDCYFQVKTALKAGRWVYFSGMQCQVAALKSYLGKEYEKLITQDTVCHSVPSPMVWKDYGLSENMVIVCSPCCEIIKALRFLCNRRAIDSITYKEELLDIIDDGRRNPSSIGDAIKELYDNIATLSGTVALRDVYADKAELPSQTKRIGPNLEYMLQAAAKGLDGREGDTIDGETITNAASVQISLTIGSAKLLLTGDCAPEAIPDSEDLSEYSHIQLPHHGKPSLAEKLFERIGQNNDMIYVVSDNTGNSNGGSDDLNTRGRNIKNTQNGDVDITTFSSSSYNTYTRRTLGL